MTSDADAAAAAKKTGLTALLAEEGGSLERSCTMPQENIVMLITDRISLKYSTPYLRVESNN